VLLAAIKPSVPLSSSPPASSSRSSGASPRIVVHPQEFRPLVPCSGPDEDGWETAVSRRSRKKIRRLERCPRRPVPVDLRGRCFNCFSTSHRAASCTSVARCSRCRKLGHRSHNCIVRRAASPASCATRLV
jgi:hypothetical protein